VNIEEACRLAAWLCDNGSDTILLAGTTGESPTLTYEEELTLYKEVKDSLGSKGKVMVGAGSNSTATAVEATKKVSKLGIDAILSVVPYYNKPSQEGMYQHFKKVAENTELPIFIYNIPGRTGINMLPETTARLAELKNIAGLKAASGDIEQIVKTSKLCPEDFVIYSGDDGLTLEMVKQARGRGVISVSSHLAGLDLKKMIESARANDLVQAEEINKKLQELFKVLFITSNPAPVKYAMSLKGFSVGIPRLPMVEPTAEEKETVKKVISALGLL
jgi:4-hydroxy-tetrahydrodipicolinate synthase